MTTLNSVTATDSSGWEPLEWMDFQLIDGDPDVQVQPIAENQGAVRLSGFATAQPSKFKIEMPNTEALYLLEGRLTAELDDGTAIELAAGDSGFFPKGSVVTWTIHEAIKEFFVLTD
ncbi:MAG: uncharacterized protein QOE60_1512 [Thermoleophilaceae bacterium]|jgi:uncharacterized cupin superfamily protein|nr:uncharacterized protein [Thermoleophilaceae bacterium]